MKADHRPTRRKLVTQGLAAAAFIVAPHPVRAQRAGSPSFGTARHQFTLVRGARPVPSVRIPCLNGKAINLSALRGKVVLVNFWATWCPACRLELPVLDRLAAMSAGSALQVLAISADREGDAGVAAFVKKLNLRHLDVGLDPGGLIARNGDGDAPDTPFGLYGMPISYLIGMTGQVEGYIAGEADWLSPDARRLLDHYAAVDAG